MFWRVLLLAVFLCGTAEARVLKIGSKRFTESYILAEIVAAAARQEGLEVVHEQGLGGTAVTARALEEGVIDVYPEYTGTIVEAITNKGGSLETRGLAVTKSLGFENTYALAVRPGVSIERISQLTEHPELRISLSHELLGRSDGWPGLAQHYGLSAAKPTAIDHALAYEAIAKSTIDVTDVYTTDAKIARYGLTVLEDDKHFFPPYFAVLLYRHDSLTPALERVFRRLEGSITAAEMQAMNAKAEQGFGFGGIAAERFGGASAAVSRPSFVSGLVESIVRHGPRHLALVFGSLVGSMLLGVPLGILAFSRKRVGGLVLGVTGVVQTIPSLALFCFLIPVFGIGWVPAVIALFAYGLLPIVRNTHAGLASIPENLREAAQALGLNRQERLRYVELPLASRTILAGIKTSAVVAVGSATIAAFIGAGGFGDPISTGLSLNNVPTILQGALPAAGLALLVQAGFALLERLVVPKGLG